MNNLNYMDKLLAGVEVEWKPLGEVADVTKLAGYEFTEHIKYSDHGSIIALRGLNIKNGDLNLTSVKYIDGSNFKKLSRSKLYINDMLFTYVGTIGEVALIDVDDKYYLAPNVARIRFTSDFIIPKFMRFYFQSNLFVDTQINRYLSCSSMKNLTMENIRKFLVPIPPLAIQAEIVRMLDTFTELTARKKQYTYYRDQLLTFEEGQVEWKPLGEVAELVRGAGLPKADFTETGVPAIHYGQIYTYYGTFTTETKSFVSHETAKKLKKVDTGDVVITNTSENLEDVGKALVYLGKVQAVTGGHATIFKPSKHILGKYFAYFTQTEMFASQKRKYAKGTKVIDVSATDMSKILIPTPSITEQTRIVAILDKFDALTNSITEGLPREIELRQRQYEYYREMLLSFPKVKVTS